MIDPKFTNWRKSTRSGSANGNCVEVATASDGTVGVRDSKHPIGPALEFTPRQWRIFLASIRTGELG